MGITSGIGRVAVVLGSMALFLGCATRPTVSLQKLPPSVPLDGLVDLCPFSDVKVSIAAPLRWEALPVNRSLLYTHQQWRSPTKATGVGVLFVRLPMPISAETLIKLARLEYSKTNKDGKVFKQWTDDLGRPWFEGENAKYHVKGYAVTNGLNAWIVYTGYRLSMPPDPNEQAMADRSLATIAPLSARPANAQAAAN